MKKRKKDIIPTYDAYSVGKVTGAIFFDTRRVKKEDLYPVKYRVTFNRDRKYFDTGFSFTVSEWNSLPGTKNNQLKETRGMLTDGNSVIKEHVKDLIKSNNFSFPALESRLKKGDNSNINIAFEKKIEKLKNNGQVGTASIYDSALKSLSDFNKNKELRFNSVTPDWLRNYERWFVGDDKNSFATASIYLRCLRAIFNEAIRDGVVSNYPFGSGKYDIPSSPGRNMALNLAQIKIIRDYRVEPGSTTEKMRDLWLFIYMANGMNIKDLISLKWKNISNGEIVYFREKTKNTSREKKPIVVPVLTEMQATFDKWGNTDRSPESFVFGYLESRKTSPERIRVVSQNLTRLMNKHLKKITDATELPHVSTYTARHSFSTVLLRSGANVEFISEALGHSSIDTTKAYLAGFETDARRKMNENLLNFSNDEQ